MPAGDQMVLSKDWMLHEKSPDIKKKLPLEVSEGMASIRKGQSCLSQTGSNARVWAASVSHLPTAHPAEPSPVLTADAALWGRAAGTVSLLVVRRAWTFWLNESLPFLLLLQRALLSNRAGLECVFSWRHRGPHFLQDFCLFCIWEKTFE